MQFTTCLAVLLFFVNIHECLIDALFLFASWFFVICSLERFWYFHNGRYDSLIILVPSLSLFYSSHPFSIFLCFIYVRLFHFSLLWSNGNFCMVLLDLSLMNFQLPLVNIPFLFYIKEVVVLCFQAYTCSKIDKNVI